MLLAASPALKIVRVLQKLHMYMKKQKVFSNLSKLARLRRPPAAFLLNEAITRPTTITKTFGQPNPSYMQSFIKIRGAVLEKNGNNTMTLCNFNKDVPNENILIQVLANHSKH